MTPSPVYPATCVSGAAGSHAHTAAAGAQKVCDTLILFVCLFIYLFLQRTDSRAHSDPGDALTFDPPEAEKEEVVLAAAEREALCGGLACVKCLSCGGPGPTGSQLCLQRPRKTALPRPPLPFPLHGGWAGHRSQGGTGLEPDPEEKKRRRAKPPLSQSDSGLSREELPVDSPRPLLPTHTHTHILEHLTRVGWELKLKG